MEWYKATIETTVFGAELVMGVLIDKGVRSAEIINPRERVMHLTEVERTWDYADEGLLEMESDSVWVVFYVTKDRAGEGVIEEVRGAIDGLADDGFDDLRGCGIVLSGANDSEWKDEWKKHFKTLKIGRVVIVPEWEEYVPQARKGLSFGGACCDIGLGEVKPEVVFRIDPGSAFGTGQHQTTQLCISALQKYIGCGDLVLDIGCGSGILSIISLLLGAEKVLACDIDPAGAIAATKMNAGLNDIDLTRLEIYAGDALSDEGLRSAIFARKYDVIVANIVADVVIGLVPLVMQVLKPGGYFIASGIIDTRAEEVKEALKPMVLLENITLEGWHCMAAQLKES